MLPYFKKSERFLSELTKENEAYHGTEGENGVQHPSHSWPVNNVMLEAFMERGYKTGDVNGPLEDKGFWDNVQVTKLFA